MNLSPLHSPCVLFYDEYVKKILLVLVIVLVVALAGGTLYWYFVLSQKPASEIAPGMKTKPSPAVGFGSLRPYAKLCANFQKVNYEISCEKAVSLALEKAQGEIQKVSIGSVRTVIPGSSPLKRGNVDVWLIDVKLQQPRFDENFKREVKQLRIGVGLHQHWGFYTQVLE